MSHRTSGPGALNWHPSLLAVVVALFAGAVMLAQPGGSPPPGDPYPNFDIRTLKAEGRLDDRSSAYLDRNTPTPVPGQPDDPVRRPTLDRLGAAYRALLIETSPALGVPEVIGVAPQSGFLSGPSSDRAATLLAFLRTFSSAYGLAPATVPDLVLVADYVNPAGNMAWVEFEQRISGLPVFQGRVRGGFTARGELARTTGLLAAGVDGAMPPVTPAFDAAGAIALAAGAVGLDPGANENRAWLLYFPLATGAMRLAWAAETWGDPNAYLTIVDAEDGTPLFRQNLTSYQTLPATYGVYTSDSPAPSSPTLALPGANFQAPFVARQSITLIGNEPPFGFNSLGWMADNTNVPNGATEGNNVRAGVDRDGINGIDQVVQGVGRNFDLDYDPASDSPLTPPYQQGEVINLFYWVNRFHDAMYLRGFTEPAGNFQSDNFARGGVGGDRINAEAQDSSGTSNANFSTAADGTFARLQMFLWTAPTPDRGGALDQDVVLHELTHGLSRRLHANGAGLTTNMSQGLGEGWSDFYARALLTSPDEDGSGVFTIGAWVTLQLLGAGSTDNYYYGIRRFPYAPRSLRAANGGRHSPLTFADIDSTQFDVSDAAFPAGPLGSTTPDAVHNIGEVWAGMLMEVRSRFMARLGTAGNERWLQFVTDGMKLDPASPTFIQARDSILAAAAAGGATPADIADIWRGFANRGLGVGASVTTAGSGGSTRVVENFTAPGDPVPTLSINDVSVVEGNAGSQTVTFTVSLANQAGPASVQYSTQDGTATNATQATTVPANMTIPATGTTGIASPYPLLINIAGAPPSLGSLSVSLTSLSHTFPSDLDILLVGPGGQKVMLLSDAGGSTPVTGINLVLSDGGPPATSAALTSGMYHPTDLQPGDVLPAPAPAGPHATALSVFNGTNPNGTWSLFVYDDAGGDVGTLGGVTLGFETTAGDYFQSLGTLTLPDGVTSRPISVTVHGDTAAEPHETFSVVLANAVNAAIGDGAGQGLIINDDGGGPAPAGAADSYVAFVNSTLTVAAPGVLANDAADGGGPLSASLASGPAHGSLAFNVNGSFVYTPAAGYLGPDSFTYRALNAFALSAPTTVSISVASAPAAAPDTFATAFQTPLTIAAPGVLGNDNPNGGGTMTALLVSGVAHGSLAVDANGGFVYTPAAGYQGPDGFTYRASTVAGQSGAVAVSIAVGPPPSAVGDSYVTAFETALAVPAPGVLGNDSSHGGGALSAVLVSSTAHGALALAADGSFTYTPAAGFAGSDSFSYRAQAAGPGNAATVIIAVNEPTTIQPPTGLYVSALAGNTVTFRFDAPAIGPDATGFVLEGGLNPGQVLASIATGSDAPIFTIVAPDGSFYVRMHALAGGDKSAASSEIRIHVNVPVPPSPPADLTAMVNGDHVVLAWRNTFEGGPPAAIVLDVSGDATATLPLGSGESFSAAGVPPGTYTVSVRAANAGGASAGSHAVTLTIPGPCSGPPGPPQRFLFYRLGSVAYAVWDPPAAGPAASSYVLSVTGSFTASFATAGRALSGQAGPGTYTVSVAAANPCGSSAPAPAQTIVVP